MQCAILFILCVRVPFHILAKRLTQRFPRSHIAVAHYLVGELKCIWSQWQRIDHICLQSTCRTQMRECQLNFVWNFILCRVTARGRHGEREKEKTTASQWPHLCQTLAILRFLFIVRNLCTNCTHALNRKTKVLPFIQMVDIIGDDWAPATIYVPNRLTFQVFGTACILTRCRNLQHVLFRCASASPTLTFSHSFCLSISALTTLGGYFVIFISLAFFVRFLNLCCCELNSSSWQALCIPVLLGWLAAACAAHIANGKMNTRLAMTLKICANASRHTGNQITLRLNQIVSTVYANRTQKMMLQDVVV